MAAQTGLDPEEVQRVLDVVAGRLQRRLGARHVTGCENGCAILPPYPFLWSGLPRPSPNPRIDGIDRICPGRPLDASKPHRKNPLISPERFPKTPPIAGRNSDELC